MRPPWLRSLTGCLQMIVRSADDVEVDAGEVTVGELRPRAFRELCEALDDGQRLCLAWMTLADLAVWPQLPYAAAHALAGELKSGGRPTLSPPHKLMSLADVGVRGAAEILPLISAVTNNDKNRVHWSAIRTSVNAFAKNSDNPIAYWEKWLRRVVPTVVTTSVAAARALAIDALKGTLNAPVRWSYRARKDDDNEVNAEPKLTVCIATPGRDWNVVQTLGSFLEYRPVGRRISARFTPSVAIDRYRMGYLFRSTCMTDLLDDQFTGLYDSVACLNASTGERWEYSSL